MIYIDHSDLEKAIIVSSMYLGNLNEELILEHIYNVLYSVRKIPADENLHITIACVQLLNGGARKPLVIIENDVKRRDVLLELQIITAPVYQEQSL